MTLDYSLIGKRIKKRRKRLDMTQEQVAECVDVSSQHMSNIERAVSIPSTEVIMKLAVALDTTPDEFLVGSGKFPGENWKAVADKLRLLNDRQLDLMFGRPAGSRGRHGFYTSRRVVLVVKNS